ncbi:MAG: hypothetical protein AAGK97_02775 [Bacteroidota bacterium]
MEKTFDYSRYANGHEILFRALLQELTFLRKQENIDLESDQFHFYDIRKNEALHYASILRVDFSNYFWGCLGKPPCDWHKPEDDSEIFEIESEVVSKDIILLPFAETSYHFFINNAPIVKNEITSTEQLFKAMQDAKVSFEYDNSILDISQQQEFNAFKAKGRLDREDVGKILYFYVAETLQDSVQNIFEFQFKLK